MSTHNPEQNLAANRPNPARQKEKTILEKLQTLTRMTAALYTAIQILELEILELPNVNLESGIDFYEEVERFEVGLIKIALRHSGGSQTRAAQLLGLKVTTLNSKTIRPQRLHQRIFRHYMTVVFNKCDECVNKFRSKRNYTFTGI